MKEPKLKPELVPEPLWRLSAYRVLPRSTWDRIRGVIRAEYGNRCSVCGVMQDKGMICHEIWNYDDSQLVATLTGFAILCPNCNAVHHMGLAGVQGFAQEALTHMARVNGMSLRDIAALVREEFSKWKQRSQRSWRICVDTSLISRFPELELLDSLSGSPGGGSRRLNAKEPS